MTSKAYVPGEDRFYIVDAKVCPDCGQVRLEYDGCDCQDAKWLLLRDFTQTQHDTLIAILGRMKIGDVYYEGLIRGQITAYEKIIELMENVKND
jgi:hypothetical protein